MKSEISGIFLYSVSLFVRLRRLHLAHPLKYVDVTLELRLVYTAFAEDIVLMAFSFNGLWHQLTHVLQ